MEDILWINPQGSTVAQLNGLVDNVESRYVCIALPSVWYGLAPGTCETRLRQAQVIHCGLQVKSAEIFETLTAVSFNWNFLAPDKSHDNYSWKATEHIMAFRTETFRVLGGFDTGFSLTASMAEFCYRVVRSGGLVQYVASLITEPKVLPEACVTPNDEVLFAKLHLSSNHARLLKAFFFLQFRPVRIPVKSPSLLKEGKLLSGIVQERPLRPVSDYTAIIPTILRYEYIGKSIESLLTNEYPPQEISVGDQSPVHTRQPKVYQPYIEKGVLRVFYLDEAGQCTSRNLAIHEAKTEWLLFFEDDTEAWPGMMREHRYLVEHSRADVSTGVSLAPWKDEGYIPERLQKYHVADVLATGNCFMRRDTALEVNGLHTAFNRGSGADDDFGRRLFLAGKLIVYNYKAIQTHHKAPSGGMRVHGAWWRNASRLWEAYPLPTQVYLMLKFYSSKFHPIQFVIFYAQLRRRSGIVHYLVNCLLAPIKVIRSVRAGKQLLREHG